MTTHNNFAEIKKWCKIKQEELKDDVLDNLCVVAILEDKINYLNTLLKSGYSHNSAMNLCIENDFHECLKIIIEHRYDKHIIYGELENIKVIAQNNASFMCIFILIEIIENILNRHNKIIFTCLISASDIDDDFKTWGKSLAMTAGSNFTDIACKEAIIGKHLNYLFILVTLDYKINKSDIYLCLEDDMYKYIDIIFKKKSIPDNELKEYLKKAQKIFAIGCAVLIMHHFISN